MTNGVAGDNLYKTKDFLFKYYMVRTNQRLGRTARTGPAWRSAVPKTISNHNNTLLSSDRLAGNKKLYHLYTAKSEKILNTLAISLYSRTSKYS